MKCFESCLYEKILFLIVCNFDNVLLLFVSEVVYLYENN